MSPEVNIPTIGDGWWTNGKFNRIPNMPNMFFLAPVFPDNKNGWPRGNRVEFSLTQNYRNMYSSIYIIYPIIISFYEMQVQSINSLYYTFVYSTLHLQYRHKTGLFTFLHWTHSLFILHKTLFSYHWLDV